MEKKRQFHEICGKIRLKCGFGARSASAAANRLRVRQKASPAHRQLKPFGLSHWFPYQLNVSLAIVLRQTNASSRRSAGAAPLLGDALRRAGAHHVGDGFDHGECRLADHRRRYRY